MITVFTTNQCSYCNMVKKFLSMKGRDYEVVNLEDNPDIRQSLYEKTGAMTVPITKINEEYVIGWNPSKLLSLIQG